VRFRRAGGNFFIQGFQLTSKKVNLGIFIEIFFSSSKRTFSVKEYKSMTFFVWVDSLFTVPVLINDKERDMNYTARHHFLTFQNRQRNF
jgi:hypothetical protein